MHLLKMIRGFVWISRLRVCSAADLFFPRHFYSPSPDINAIRQNRDSILIRSSRQLRKSSLFHEKIKALDEARDLVLNNIQHVPILTNNIHSYFRNYIRIELRTIKKANPFKDILLSKVLRKSN